MLEPAGHLDSPALLRWLLTGAQKKFNTPMTLKSPELLDVDQGGTSVGEWFGICAQTADQSHLGWRRRDLMNRISFARIRTTPDQSPQHQQQEDAERDGDNGSALLQSDSTIDSKCSPLCWLVFYVLFAVRPAC